MLHRRDFIAATAGLGLALVTSGRALAAGPAAETIRALIEQRLGAGAQVSGMVAVAVDDTGERTVAVGSADVPGLALDGQTVGQIGSITKVLTALLLAEMAARGEVAFDDPVTKHLPPALTLRERGRPITLLDLATYTSGLPNMPGNMPPRWWEKPNPYADYTEAKLAEFLAGYEPEYAPGTQYRYANLGFGLLGIALAHRAGRSYEDLLVERVCDPLGLDHTRMTLTDDMRRHLAQGHNQDLSPTPLWDMVTLPGGGGMRSSVADMAQFLKFAIGREQTPASAAFARLLETRRPTPVAGTEVGLGWFISSNPSDEIVWKSGLGGGFSSYLGFSTRSGRGAFVLSNALPVGGVGFRLVDPEFNPGPVGDLLM